MLDVWDTRMGGWQILNSAESTKETEKESWL